MRLDLADIATVTGGVAHGEAVVDGASIDSRTTRPGALFVALVAERDGHDYVGDAVAAGAAAVMADREVDAPAAVIVPDTAAGLTAVGRLARDRLPDRVVGITGSVGKTSCKDLCAAALATEQRVFASERSFNNELGVPITLAGAPDGTEAVIVEMGARGRDHVAGLCAVARPTVGVVTRVALAHAELFGTIEEVARAKGELVEALPASGTAVLNADDERVAAMAGRTAASVLSYGSGPDVEVRVEGVALDDHLRPSFTLRTPWGAADVTLEARGTHNAGNAAAAAAAALACGVGLEAVVAGLAGATLSPWRMDVVTVASGAVVLNDAYNANGASTRAAIDALAALPARRRVAVLGEMAELGEASEVEHRAVREHAEAAGIEVIAVAAPHYGGRDVPDLDAALEALGEVGEGDAVLVKGSRVAGLERLVERL